MKGRILELDTVTSSVSNKKFEDVIEKVTDFTISPLFAEENKLKKLPKVVIHVSEHDVLKDDGVLMYKRLKVKVATQLQSEIKRQKNINC